MKFSLTRIDDALHISVRGDITESAEDELSELQDKIEVGKVVFDTSKVDLINSLGIRNWINFVQSLRRRKVLINYEKCSLAAIECCNMHQAFAQKGEVVSFCVPMHCTACSKSFPHYFETKAVTENFELPESRCPGCSGAADPEVDTETYLMFLRV